jgi:hypothetical protein
MRAPLFTSVEYAEQVEKDDDEDRHASEPEDDVSKHGWSPSSGWSDATALVAELEPLPTLVKSACSRLTPLGNRAGGVPRGSPQGRQLLTRKDLDQHSQLCSRPGMNPD